jgi:hypothetical protein
MPLNHDTFEDELRAALRREPAPPDFAARLRRRLPTPIWQRPVVWAVAAALLLAALIPPAVSQHRRQERERALEARRQLIVALKITSIKLRQTRERIQRATRHTI